MKVGEAVAIANRTVLSGAPVRTVAFMCGFTPLHLETFLKARLKLRFADTHIQIQTGLFGDLAGNLERAAQLEARDFAVVMEWGDLDPRLGWRQAGGWGLRTVEDVPGQTQAALARILAALGKLAGRGVIALCPPSLATSLAGHTPPAQASALRLALDAQMADFLRRAAALDGVRVLDRPEIDHASPAAERLDLRLELSTGFPYRTSHADVIARVLVEVLYPPAPRKGIITDLDDVMWRGILGEIGPEAVSWELARHSQEHALYQQTLAALADYGVLVACATKNDPELVRQVFKRGDMLIGEQQIFPMEVHWGAKSESVARILKAWNIAADSAVFVDDSAMELAEVEARHPGIECMRFPTGDPEGVWRLIQSLRARFGKPVVLQEDHIRAASLRVAPEFSDAASADTNFLERAEGIVTFDTVKNPADPRPLELVNKTNQFNLNGRRFTDAEWRALVADPDSFTLVISYQDRFGPLGKIAVAAGRLRGASAQIETWVMSCRAFSRRIEHHTLNFLFSRFGLDEISLCYASTERNGPLREFLGGFCALESLPMVIVREKFSASGLALPHVVKEIR